MSDSVELEFYLWPSTFVNDHVALRISEIGLYISWSPKHGKKAKDAEGYATGTNNLLDCESRPKTLEQDYEEESGRQPKEIISLQIARDKAETIKNWWDAYRRRRENYRLHSNNCCHIVLRSLAKAVPAFGHLDKYFLHPGRLAEFISRLSTRGGELEDDDVEAVKEEIEKDWVMAGIFVDAGV